MLRWGVVERDLFPWRNQAQGVKENSSVRDPAEGVRRTGVVDKCRRAATSASVDAPARIGLADADFSALRHPRPRLAGGDFFPSELPEFLSRRQSH